jgi:hypothetical protein
VQPPITTYQAHQTGNGDLEQGIGVTATGPRTVMAGGGIADTINLYRRVARGGSVDSGGDANIEAGSAAGRKP